MTNKTIVTLIALVAIVCSISGTVYAAETLFGDECYQYKSDSLKHKTCNDVNNLNDRVVELESITSDGLDTYVNISSGLLIYAESWDTLGVNCDNSDLVLSGGYTADPELTVTDIGPSTLLNGWTVEFLNPTADEYTVTIHALCLSQ